ncbi:TRAP transporter substrate-binding protein [Roseinatronobacter monicus]|uniref:Tripartite ATP-independent transporter DctP family solute receptor n=1 Tax=Roseinatronobacter monicus TaxID=393481 RepID=A0A543KH57_9RHOB|nr:TRAP transporter substrate-binding protein [Roseinatronobacter monicus]TQM94357.1 tripartite ATP-independent transporter DctP family solute receptor [Roseinatronobacter monicus]
MKYQTLGAALLASAAFVAPAFAQDIVLRSSDTHPPGYPTVAAVEYMGELISERTDGRIAVQVYHSAQLGEESDTIEQTQFGVIDLNRISMGPFNNLIEATKAPSMPFIFRDVAHMRAVMDGEIGEEILAEFDDHNLVGLAFYDAGARSMYNRQRPIESLEDMEGLRIRVIQSDLFVDMIGALGANATPMPYGEVYSSIQTGVIDGVENNWPSYESSGHYEVAGYYTLTEHLIVPEVLVMSKPSWDALSEEDQAIIREAAQDSVAHQRELWEAREATSEEHVRAAGATVNEIDKGPFQEAMGPVYERHAESDELRTLIERIQAVE